MDKTIPEFYKLKRNVIAYDGDVLKEFNQANATHIIIDPQAMVKECLKKKFFYKFIF